MLSRMESSFSKQPKVSVIIPVYNADKYLTECMDSVISQTLKDIEIICIDDGSSDESMKILRNYEKSDSRIRVFAQKHSNAGTARNKGLSYATGEYLSFLDADDFFESNMLQKAYEVAVKCKAEIVVFGSDAVNNNTDSHRKLRFTIRENNIPTKIPFEATDINRDFFATFAGWAWDKLFCREYIHTNRFFFQEQRTTNDLKFTYMSLASAKRIAIVQDILVHHRTHIKTSLEATRSESYKCFYEALVMLREELVTAGLFKRFEQDYINYSLSFCLENLNAMSGRTRRAIYDSLRKSWLKELGITAHSREYYYHWDAYLNYRLIMRLPYDEIGKYLHRTVKYVRYIRNLSVEPTKFEIVEMANNPSEDPMFTKKATYTGYSVDDLNCRFLTREERACELKQVFYRHCHYYLNLDEPKTFNQKINWLKLYWYHTDFPRAVDKAEFKKYIAEKLGEGYTVPLLGVYEKESQIDFDTLPKRFVLKSTIQSDGRHIIRVTDKDTLDYDRLLTVLSSWLLPRNSLKSSYCCAYNSINPRIIAEEYIEGIGGELYDYKFFCFNGQAKLLYVSSEILRNLSMSFYDLNWNLMPFKRIAYPRITNSIKKPINFEKMIEIAEILAKPFPFVRVDFYETNEEKMYIGEMTFYPAGGYGTFEPAEWDLKLGELLELPKANLS